MRPMHLLLASIILLACSTGVSFLVLGGSTDDDSAGSESSKTMDLYRAGLNSKNKSLQQVEQSLESARKKVRLLSREKEELARNLNMLKQQIEKQEMAEKAKHITIEELLAELKSKPSREGFNLARKLIKENLEKGLEAAFAVLKGELDWKARHNLVLLVYGFHEQMTDEQLKVLLDMYQKEEHEDIRSLLLGPIQMRKPAFGVPVYRKIFEESDDFYVRLQMAGLLCANGKKDAELWLHKQYKNAEKDLDKIILKGKIATYGGKDSLPLIHKFIEPYQEFSHEVEYYLEGLVRIGDESSLDFLRNKIESCKNEHFLNLLKKAYNEIAKDEFYPIK